VAALSLPHARPANDASFRFTGFTGLLTPATPSFKTLDHILEDSNIVTFCEPQTKVVEPSNLQSVMVDPKNEMQSCQSGRSSSPTSYPINLDRRFKHSVHPPRSSSLPTPPSTPCPVFISSEYSQGHIPKDSIRVTRQSKLGSLEVHKHPERRRVLLGPRPQTSTSVSSYLKNSSQVGNLPSPLRRQTLPSLAPSGTSSTNSS